MIIKIKYEKDGYEYTIPLSKLLPFLQITKEQIEEACKKAIMRI